VTSALPDLSTLEAALEATWPAAGIAACGPFSLRDGAGGGSRVSAATALAAADEPGIAAAEAAMRAAGHRPLFRLRPGLCAWDGPLDAALAARGYARRDPTLYYAAPVARLAPEPLPAMRVFPIWPPLAIQRDLWAEAGIGPARLAVMGRVTRPKAALMARQDDRVAGTAFVALCGEVAMLHAMEVTRALRRRGAARNLTRAAAEWAAAQGAAWLALAVTEANAPARALYAGLGMAAPGGYHYRVLEEEPRA
jgi:GNAT superfamily N-acetyltransferase